MTDTATRTLSEYDSKRLLASEGVPVLDERLAADADAAVLAARETSASGAPVVLKLCGAGVAHKTERGLVRLGLRGDDEVREAAEALLAAARPEDSADGVLVAPMAADNRSEDVRRGVITPPRVKGRVAFPGPATLMRQIVRLGVTGATSDRTVGELAPALPRAQSE